MDAIIEDDEYTRTFLDSVPRGAIDLDATDDESRALRARAAPARSSVPTSWPHKRRFRFPLFRRLGRYLAQMADVGAFLDVAAAACFAQVSRQCETAANAWRSWTTAVSLQEGEIVQSRSAVLAKSVRSSAADLTLDFLSKHYPRLISLDLRGNFVSRHLLLEVLPRFPELRHLDMRDCPSHNPLQKCDLHEFIDAMRLSDHYLEVYVESCLAQELDGMPFFYFREELDLDSFSRDLDASPFQPVEVAKVKKACREFATLRNVGLAPLVKQTLREAMPHLEIKESTVKIVIEPILEEEKHMWFWDEIDMSEPLGKTFAEYVECVRRLGSSFSRADLEFISVDYDYSIHDDESPGTLGGYGISLAHARHFDVQPDDCLHVIVRILPDRDEFEDVSDDELDF